jgi:hypothetical protein
MLKLTADNDILQACIPWISRCIHLAERDRKYFNNVYPLYLAIYARCLYQSGYKAGGVGQQRRLVNLLKKYPAGAFTKDKEAEDRLEKMENNETL